MSTAPIRLQDLPADQRPRERLYHQGAAALSLPELIAILIRTGLKGASAVDIGSSLCARFGTLEALARATVEELTTQPGLGRDKAVTLKAAFELGRRLHGGCPEEQPLMDTPERVAAALRSEALTLEVERVWLLPLDSRRRLIRRIVLSDGILNQSLVHAREVFRAAILANAHGFVLAHNHPSGDPTPSDSDSKVTRELIRVSRIMNIDFLDHVIIGRRTEGRPVDWISMRGLGYWA